MFERDWLRMDGIEASTSTIGRHHMTTQHTSAPTTAPRSSLLQYEDLAGKFVLLMFFIWLLYGSVLSAAGHIVKAEHDWMWVLGLISKITSLAFAGLIVGLTVIRKPPVDVAAGLEARISSFIGTFILLALIAVPRSEISSAQALISTVLIIVGTASSVWCLWWLGRNFSVMAAARELVVAGPYAHVRHPLYTAEAITVVGVVLSNGSLLAVLVGAIQFFFQYRRIKNEEKVLSAVFDGYADYKKSTPMILPGLR
jgi:protein-S-isoprenylcysteine O-methyltransferase Ste14